MSKAGNVTWHCAAKCLRRELSLVICTLNAILVTPVLLMGVLGILLNIADVVSWLQAAGHIRNV